MTEADKNYERFTGSRGAAVLSAVLTVAGLAALAAGLFFGFQGEAQTVLLSPLEGRGGELFKKAVLYCSGDIITLLLITIAARTLASAAVATAVTALRCAALGLAASFCTVNAVPAEATAFIIAFILSTLLIMAYAVFINRLSREAGLLSRFLCYMTVCGAAALLRILPMLLM